MDSVKVTYIICVAVNQLALLGLAVFAPLWITPGYYWWSVFAILVMASTSYNFTQRMNSWGCGYVGDKND